MRRFVIFDHADNSSLEGVELKTKKVVLEVNDHFRIYDCLSAMLDENVGYILNWVDK